MIIDSQALAEWKQRAARQPQGRTVLDLEADSLHRHREKLCLIQYGDVDGVKLIDPLAIEDMRFFSSWLEDSEVWMHGADYDMSLLQQAYSILPAMILDTQIAARLLGFKSFGLASLVEHFFGVLMSKKNQKADWGKRPISPAMQDYAQGDVKYMLEMADMLVAQLKEKGRYDWFLESCASNLEKGRARYGQTNPDAWRIKGSGKLTRRGLAALKILWTWRDSEAAEWDRPAFMVCSNDDLLRWSLALQEFRTATPRRNFHSHRAARFTKSVERFQAMDEHDYPKRPPRIRREQDEQFEARLAVWMEKRSRAAEQTGIEAAFIASRQQLESIAGDESNGPQLLLNWQRGLLCD